LSNIDSVVEAECPLLFSSVQCGLIVRHSETTKLYLKVTEPELVGAMFDKALERYTTSDVDQFTKGQQG
jgi:hypothetical protein